MNTVKVKYLDALCKYLMYDRTKNKRKTNQVKDKSNTTTQCGTILPFTPILLFKALYRLHLFSFQVGRLALAYMLHFKKIAQVKKKQQKAKVNK